MKSTSGMHITIDVCGPKRCVKVRDVLIDTGASFSFVQKRTMEKAGIPVTDRNAATIGNGEKMAYESGSGSVCITATDGVRECTPATIATTPNKDGVVLGIDAMRGLGMKIDLDRDQVTIAGARGRP